MLKKENQKGAEKKRNQTYCPTNNCSTKYAYNYYRVTRGTQERIQVENRLCDEIPKVK